MIVKSITFCEAVRIGGEVYGFATDVKHSISLDRELGAFAITPIGKEDFVYVPLSNVRFWKHEEDSKQAGKKPTPK